MPAKAVRELLSHNNNDPTHRRGILTNYETALPAEEAMEIKGFLIAVMLLFVSAASVWAYKKAPFAKSLRKLAGQGDADAQSRLGYMYYQGQGVPQDYAAALKWYRLAADQGNAEAQFDLAFMYYEGLGVLQDSAAALKWYRLAAAQGDAKAQFNVGLMYYEGLGVPQDYAEALKWYRLAAAQGYARAQYSLGYMYANGEGVPQDHVQAHKWLTLATITFTDKPERDEAIKARNSVAAQMTPAQIAEAQKLAREWKRQ